MRIGGLVFTGLVGIIFSAALIIQGSVINNNKEIKKVPTTHKVVALTLDDGPHYNITPQILAVLREKKVKVTFFVLGKHAAAHPEIVAQEVADGHEVASHAYSHIFLSKLSKEEIGEELDNAERAITVVAPKPTLFRPPGGAYNDKVVAEAQTRGYTTILWSVDPGDWRGPSVSHIVDNVMNHVKPGSIVLLHDGQDPLPTPKAIGIIIDKLHEQGYSIITVSELLQYYEVHN
ncbi:MAG: polysaccharide deacetylase [Pelosinus sp.]|jgi:polysaccharide deacetylase family sporulation protein PdaB|nr:polysaccharide deacetylase [Pelosinus sp.]